MGVWKKPTLAELVAGQIRKNIGSGEYGVTLPGENRLVAQMGVSRGTIRAALKILETEGWVGSSQGKSRTILKPTDEKPGEVPRIHLLMPRDRFQMGAPLNQMLVVLRNSLEGVAVVEVCVSAAVKMESPARHLHRVIGSLHADLWILVQSSGATQVWFAENGIPCLVLGTAAESCPFSWLDVDWAATGTHLVGTVARYGHERVLVVERHRQAAGSQALKKAYTEGFEMHGIEYRCLFPEFGVVALLEKVMTGNASNGPTMLVFYEQENLVTGLTWLMAKGWRIPQDISLICLDADDSILHLYPQVAHYRRPIELLGKSLAGMVRQHLIGQGKGESKHCLQEFVAGDSLKNWK